MDDNWIVENLEGAYVTWNSKLTEIWSLVSETPQNFKGGAIWTLAQDINTALQAVGYGLLILFFAISIFRSTANFQDFRRPEHILRYFIRFVTAKTAVTYGMDIMTTLFTICGGIVSTVAGSLGNLTGASVTLPEEIKTAINEVGFLASIPLWLVTILGSVFITVLSFVMILTVYSRFFPTLYVYSPGSHSALYLCGRTDIQHRAHVYQKLSRRVHGGGGHRTGLHDLLGIYQWERTRHRIPRRLGGNDGVELSG